MELVVVDVVKVIVVDEAQELAEEGVAQVVEVAVAAGKCLPLIHVWAVAAALLALALACSSSLAFFLAFSALSFSSFSLVTRSSSSLAFIICSLSLRSFLLTSSWVSRNTLFLAGALSGALAVS